MEPSIQTRKKESKRSVVNESNTTEEEEKKNKIQYASSVQVSNIFPHEKSRKNESISTFITRGIDRYVLNC